MVNTTAINNVKINNYSNKSSNKNTHNDTIYQNFINIVKNGINDENVNPNINTKVTNDLRKYKIVENSSELLSLSNTNFNIVKNSVNSVNLKDSFDSPVHTSYALKSGLPLKYNNRRLNFEILTRIFVLSDNPKTFSTVCRQWYYVSKETSSKILWFLKRVPKEIICIYLFTHPIFHAQLDANFMKILLKRGAKCDLHFLEQAIPILLKNKNGVKDGKELGLPALSYFKPVLSNPNEQNAPQKSQTILSQKEDTNTMSITNSRLFKRKCGSKTHLIIRNENDDIEINKYLEDDEFRNSIIQNYKVNHSKTYNYHYNSSLLPFFLFLYQKSKKQYIDLVENINTSFKNQLRKDDLLIENYQPIISINESINLFINSYKNDTMIPLAILDTMISSTTKTFDTHDTLIKTMTHFSSEIKNNPMVMPILREYLHQLVYQYHFIPYNIIQKPYHSKQIRTILQFMEVIWLISPEIIFKWIEWGWGDVDGQLPLLLFSAHYDCRSLASERQDNQQIYEQQCRYYCDHREEQSSFTSEDIDEIITQVNMGKKCLLDFMMEKGLKISNETFSFIMDNNIFNCPCYNTIGHSPESPCTLKNIIKYWKLSNDKESKRNTVRKLAYNAWSRKDGVGLYKMEYYLNSFNDGQDILLNINEFIMEMITLDPSIIFKQDMLGWIVNHSSSQPVKRLILYTLFKSLPKDPQSVHMVKLILNFVGDIDLKGIQLLREIERDNSVWNQLYSILIIHLYRRYVRRRINFDSQLCDAWADLFLYLNPQKFKLTSVQNRFQDELFDLLEVY